MAARSSRSPSLPTGRCHSHRGDLLQCDAMGDALRGSASLTPYAGTAYHAGLPELQPQLSGGQMLRPRRPPVRSPAYQSFTVSRHVAMCGVLVWYSNAVLLT